MTGAAPSWWLGTGGTAMLWPLFLHFLTLSLLAVGGAITTAPDMHRYLVGQQHWLSDAQFTASVALAQAAPGPNILFVAVLGWNVAGLGGSFAALLGSLLPSTTLALGATRWGARRREARGVRAFTTGMAPLTVGLLLATGWVLTDPARGRSGWSLQGCWSERSAGSEANTRLLERSARPRGSGGRKALALRFLRP